MQALAYACSLIHTHIFVNDKTKNIVFLLICSKYSVSYL